jgi:pimeloyl-ACP methyl ester carboxylesterase
MMPGQGDMMKSQMMAFVVLVPGFFNSLAPGNQYGPYFSRAIVETIEKRAQVSVVDTLSPVGGIDENGHYLVEYLDNLHKKYPDETFTLITHSAGGLYSLEALQENPSLPVKTVVTLAAPYQGIDFIENLAAHVPGLDSLAHYLNLDSLSEFRLRSMATRMKSWALPSNTRWIALAGQQEPCFFITCAESKKLSWVLTISQSLMSGSSDGIVTVRSALATDSPFKIERWNDFSIPLEHWEMVEEASLFHLIGVVDTGNIESLQKQVYSQILDRVL